METQTITQPTQAERKEAVRFVKKSIKTRRLFKMTDGFKAALDEIEQKIKEGN